MAFYDVGNGKSGKRSDEYRTRVDMIRNPETNKMSRTRARVDRYQSSKTPGTRPDGKRKKKAYDGAFVAEVRRQVHSGFAVAGSLLKHLHAFVIDMDLTSLYPTIMLLLNLSPKTFVAKLFFAKNIRPPLYDYIKFLDKKERADYKCNSNDFVMEALQGRHWWAIGEIYLNLPTTNEILSDIEDHINLYQ